MKVKVLSKLATSKVMKKIGKAVIDNAPKILTGISIVNSVASVIFAVKGTVVAVRIIDDRNAKIEKGEIPKPERPKWENVKAVWKCYVPTLACLTVSIGTSVKGMEISTARTAVATTACKLTEQAFEEYRNETINKIGEEKEKEIRQDIAKRNAEESHENAQKTLIISSYDKVLIFDDITGQLFWDTPEGVKNAINHINYELSHGYRDYISVMEYADTLGLESHDEERGWNICDGMLELIFEPDTTKEGRPCLRLSTTNKPYSGYNMYH